jgi:hypothetical protein
LSQIYCKETKKLSSFFELGRQKDVQRKHPELLRLHAMIDTDKRGGKYKEKHIYLLCILGCAERMKRAGIYLFAKGMRIMGVRGSY